ncbi:MAG: signal peptidase II [Ruminococcaceae bacterium]|nr:signal peptidase II [Oscillospiraceae bacterium]
MNQTSKKTNFLSKKKSIIVSTSVIIFSVILDQITKILADKHLTKSDEIEVIPNILGLSFVKNEGAAFGMFADNRWIFMVFSTFAIGVMIYFLLTLKDSHPLLVISLSMLIGGGIGNMIDRISRGYVIDFFKFLFVKFAVFNVADCFVTVGAVLLAIYLLFLFKDETPNEIDNNKPEEETDVKESNS